MNGIMDEKIKSRLEKGGFIIKPEGTILPPNHPACKLKPGESVIKDGIIYEYLPNKSRKIPIVAGLALDDQPGKIAMPFNSNNANEHLKQRQKLAMWLADYEGKFLPEKANQDLKDLYLSKVNEIFQIQNQKLSDNEKLKSTEVYQKLAEIISDLSIKELEIFRKYETAQIHRYGHKIKTKYNSKIKKSLEDGILQFINGDYWKILKKPGLKQYPQLQDLGKWKEIFKRFRWLDYYYPKKPQLYEIDKDKLILELDEPQIFPPSTKFGKWKIVEEKDYGYLQKVVVNKFITTGPAWGDLGNLIDDIIPNIVHTNLVAGIWRTKLKLVTEAREVTSPDGIIVTEFKESLLCEPEIHWIIANGNAASYTENDTIKHYYEGVFDDYEMAIRYLRSFQPIDGEYFANQAVAYSVGQYGTNWVCHQNCNAFAFMKWRELPYFHPQSWLAWESCGTGQTNPLCGAGSPISPPKDLFGNQHPGGAPGPWCLFFHRFPCGADVQCTVMGNNNACGWGLLQKPWTHWINGIEMESNAVCDKEVPVPNFEQLNNWVPSNPLRVVVNRWWPVT